MANLINLKTWDTNSSYSNNFLMTSKYTDLGNPDSKKSILGVILNLSVGTESTLSSHSSYRIIVKYRTSPNTNFQPFLIFYSCYFEGNVSKGSIQTIKYSNPPIRNILNIQLQIKGINIRNDFGINDFALIYRTYRDSNVVSLDEK